MRFNAARVFHYSAEPADFAQARGYAALTATGRCACGTRAVAGLARARARCFRSLLWGCLLCWSSLSLSFFLAPVLSGVVLGFVLLGRRRLVFFGGCGRLVVGGGLAPFLALVLFRRRLLVRFGLVGASFLSAVSSALPSSLLSRLFARPSLLGRPWFRALLVLGVFVFVALGFLGSFVFGRDLLLF